jgi:hypothetical protein
VTIDITLYGVAQVYMFVNTCLTLFLVTDRRRSRRRASFLLGLIGQWAWFYGAWHTSNWGLMGVNVIYVFAHFRGLYTHRPSSSLEPIR